MQRRFPSGRVVGRSFGWAAGLAFLAGLAGLATVSTSEAYPPAPAEKAPLKSLTFEMRKIAPKIMAEVRKQGYQNVGVLKFRSKIDKRATTFHAGRLNQQMSTRLENALVLA